MPPTGSWAAPHHAQPGGVQLAPAVAKATHTLQRRHDTTHCTGGRRVRDVTHISARQHRQRPSSPRRQADSQRHFTRSNTTRDKGCCLLVLDARSDVCLHSMPLARREQQPLPDEGAFAFNSTLRESERKNSQISIDLECWECFRLGQIRCGNVFVRARLGDSHSARRTAAAAAATHSGNENT